VQVRINAKRLLFGAIKRGFLPTLILAVLIAGIGFWEGPGRWRVYAGPNDVPNSGTVAACDWTAIICVIVFGVSLRSVADGHCGFL
jgi:hypothetical protein